MVLTVVRCFFLCSLFYLLLFCFILIYREQVNPGYIFLFSGSNSEQENRDEKDENVEKDLYEILDIPRTASQDEIRRAYKKCRKYVIPHHMVEALMNFNCSVELTVF